MFSVAQKLVEWALLRNMHLLAALVVLIVVFIFMARILYRVMTQHSISLVEHGVKIDAIKEKISDTHDMIVRIASDQDKKIEEQSKKIENVFEIVASNDKVNVKKIANLDQRVSKSERDIIRIRSIRRV